MIDKIYLPNMRRIELELSTDCNLYCNNCNRSCGQAKSKEYISTEQINKFVDESIEAEYYWDCIILLGGEPTLHPFFDDIINFLKKYKDFNKKCEFEIVSNQFHKQTKEILQGLPEWIQIRDEKKKNKVHLFSRCHEAPIDKLEGDVDYSTACQITQASGLGFSRYGYYVCGPAASIDRVFGFDLGIKNIKNINIINLQRQMKKFCSLCGHFLDYRDDHKYNWTYEECQSETWVEAYKNYNEAPPKLRLYGEELDVLNEITRIKNEDILQDPVHNKG